MNCGQQTAWPLKQVCNRNKYVIEEIHGVYELSEKHCDHDKSTIKPILIIISIIQIVVMTMISTVSILHW